ncbi:hypothetical protein FACS189429_1720 [Bacteroidia bacterium]|nr:hypothetical protein FACS189429_1720 [Bacteroidia bacterium]
MLDYAAVDNVLSVSNTAREKKDGTKTDKNNERKLLWDEENRLEAIDDNGFVSNYWYDAAGERTVKTSGDAEQMYVNGLFSGGNTETAKFTAYVNAYMVVSKGGNYTKHIYIGNQRIVSKLGDLDSYGADPRRIEYAGSNVDGANVQYANKYSALQQTIKDRYAKFEVEYYGKDNDDYVNGAGFCCDNNVQNAPMRAPQANDNPELFQYYYHSDHLGSTSLITNLDGEVVQHIEYVPFGEVFIEERNNKWNTPYLFNAKELDEETGLYYYGARYYDPRTSLWLSADPMQEKYPNFSTYNYCANNPIMFVDKDGNVITLAAGFKNSDFGKVYSNLRQNNSAFNAVLQKYISTNTFNVTLKITSKQPQDKAGALTSGTSQPGRPLEPPIVSANYTTTFPDSKSRIWTENSEGKQYSQLGMVLAIAHEAVHLHIGAEYNKAEDQNHNVFNVYFRKLTDILGEYNKDNNLGLTSNQIFELALSGQGDKSTKYKNYINSLAKQNNTTFAEEAGNFNNRISNLVYEKATSNENE